MNKVSKLPVGVAFIGGGEISVLHAKAILSLPSAKLVGIWNRPNSSRMEELKQRVKGYGCKLYEKEEDLVNDPAVDAVFVMTNLETHVSYSKMALEAGKHVLVEKPVAATVADVMELDEFAKKRGLWCVPGHNMIHEASLARARQLITNGEIGKVVSCYVMYNIHHSEERASTLPGVVRHILTHNLYSMFYLVGQPKRVAAMKAMRHYEKIDQEDLTMVILELENGGLAHLCASFAADDLSPCPWTFTIKVIGTAGTTHYTYQDWVEVKKGLSHSHTYTAYQETITNENRYFIEEILMKGAEPLSSMQDAVLAQKVTEACEKSIRDGVIVDIK